MTVADPSPKSIVASHGKVFLRKDCFKHLDSHFYYFVLTTVSCVKGVKLSSDITSGSEGSPQQHETLMNMTEELNLNPHPRSEIFMFVVKQSSVGFISIPGL